MGWGLLLIVGGQWLTLSITMLSVPVLSLVFRLLKLASILAAGVPWLLYRSWDAKQTGGTLNAIDITAALLLGGLLISYFAQFL